MKRYLSITLLLVLFLQMMPENRAVLVHNSLQDIEAVKGKLKLKLVRTWGGDEEKDENKFFETPTDVAVDRNGLVYICDQHNHNIKVFQSSGEYVRTVGRRGRGPGDLYSPLYIALAPNGDLVVAEMGGFRIQRFNPLGKSSAIIKSINVAFWIGVTSKNELAVYYPEKTMRSKKLISFIDYKGKTIREIGCYHDKSTDFLSSEKLQFALDENDNIYAANSRTPIVRKYSPNGKMSLAITFETPFEIPEVEITLNEQGDEIKRTDTYKNQVKIRKSEGIIQAMGKKRVGICWGIDTDSLGRIYFVTRRRLLTEKEGKSTVVGSSFDSIIRKQVDYETVDNIKDVYRVLVFNQKGKVVAETQLPHFCNGICIKDKRMFIVDGDLYQRVLEYEMSFEQEVEEKRDKEVEEKE